MPIPVSVMFISMNSIHFFVLTIRFPPPIDHVYQGVCLFHSSVVFIDG